ncbi:MAG: SpoIID/LytB domain-containing protein, partial [Thermacetogeniaceae bacterium]
MTAQQVGRLMLLCLLAVLVACLGAPLRRANAAQAVASGVAANNTATTNNTGGGTGLMMRVALDEGVPAASFLVKQGNYTLVDSSTGLPLGAVGVGNTWTVTAAGTTLLVQGPGLKGTQPFQGPVLLQETGGGVSSDQPNLFQYNGTLYRGSLAIQNLSNQLLVLNVLDMEKYLYGVVGKEIGGTASAEALCVQAVASRSYALSMRGLSAWYDIGHDTGSEVYGGYSGEQEFACSSGNPVVDAVQRTRGQVLEYLGTLVRAYFSANAGGYTEDAENVWAESRPYLKGVASDGDAYADTLGGWAQSTYRWTKTINRSDLESQLGVGKILDIQVSRNRTRISTDPVTGSIKRDFVPGSVTVSGRATQVTVIGASGSKTF